VSETVTSWIPLAACLCSLLAVPVIAMLGKSPNLREGATFLAGLLKLGLVVSLLPMVLGGKVVECNLMPLVSGAGLSFPVDALGALSAVVASLLWLPTSCYAIGYMRGLKEHAQTRFFYFFALSLFATLGVAFAGNLLTLYVFYEILSLSTYPLVTHHQDKEARSGGRTYLTYLLGASIGLALPALLYVYSKSPESLDFVPGGFLEGKIGSTETVILLLLFAFGFAKSGLMPLHSWLPGAMVAPTPVSALLHAVAVVKVGVFCVIRVVTGVFGTDFLREMGAGTVLAWIAAFTVIVSSLIALSQDNLKRRLAFSTIGQLSYIILGVALLSPRAVGGSMMHIAMHAFGKITLFFCAGAIFVACGKKYVSQMEGLGRRMPITFGCFAIGALSVIGLPPCGGFLSKMYLVMGAMDAGQIALLVVFLVSTLLNAAYFTPVIYRAFFPRQSVVIEKGIAEAPFACLLPICFTAVLTLSGFFIPQLWQGLAQIFAGF